MEAVEFSSFWVIALIGCRSFSSFPGVFFGSSRKIRQSRVVMSATGFSVQWVWRSEILAYFSDVEMVEMVEMVAFEIWCHDFSHFSVLFFPHFLWVEPVEPEQLLALLISLSSISRCLKDNGSWPWPWQDFSAKNLQNLPESHSPWRAGRKLTRPQFDKILWNYDKLKRVRSAAVYDDWIWLLCWPCMLMLRSALYLFKWSLVKATSTHNTKVHTSPEYSARFAISSS